MSKQREGTHRRWGTLVTVTVTVALLGLGGSAATAGAGPTAPAQAPPDWCQWIPPEWLPFVPECHGSGGGVEPGGEIEEQFSAAGPSQVTTSQATDGSGTYTLFYPTNLASDGIDNPILAYGNGTGASCTDGNPTQGHLASWGFVVVCPDTGESGHGTEMWAGVQYVVSEDSNPSSVFYQKLDTANIGAIGHSGGASGAIRSTLLSNGAITSTVVLAHVDPIFHVPDGPPDLGQLDTPIFFVSGTADWLASQAQQQAYYDQAAGPAAKAALIDKDHASMIQPSLGYATAWFKYTLEGDDFARQAFVGGSPEIATNTAWTNWAAKNNLP